MTIFVVIGHSAYLNIQTTYGGVSYELPETLNVMYNSHFLSLLRGFSGWVYGFHMPMFFMLSGAVLGLKPIAKLDDVIKGKVKRLLIPYFLYGWLFMLPIKRLGNFYTNASLKQAFKGFLSGADSGHLWFLTALFWCLIVFVMLDKLLMRLEINSIYLLLFIAGIISLTYNYLPFDILGLKMGLSYIFYFSIGYVFEKERAQVKTWNYRKTLLALGILVVLEIMNIRYDILNVFFVRISGSFLTLLFCDLCSRIFKKVEYSKIWDFVIRNLFYVYLFHDPLEYIVLRIFFDNELLNYGIGCVFYTFARIVLVFVVSLGLGELVRIAKGQFSLILNKEC